MTSLDPRRVAIMARDSVADGTCYYSVRVWPALQRIPVGSTAASRATVGVLSANVRSSSVSRALPGNRHRPSTVRRAASRAISPDRFPIVLTIILHGEMVLLHRGWWGSTTQFHQSLDSGYASMGNPMI